MGGIETDYLVVGAGGAGMAFVDVLGSDSIEQTGPNAGYYPRATAVETCDYYQRVLDERSLASGRVLFANIEPAPAKPETFVATTRDAKISRSGAAGSPASAG